MPDNQRCGGGVGGGSKQEGGASVGVACSGARAMGNAGAGSLLTVSK